MQHYVSLCQADEISIPPSHCQTTGVPYYTYVFPTHSGLMFPTFYSDTKEPSPKHPRGHLRCDSQWLFDSHKHHSPWPSLYSLCSDTFNHPTVHILMRIPWRPLPTFHCDMPGISIPFMTITHDAYKCPHPTVISNSTSCPLSSVLTHDFFGQFSPVTLQRAQCPHSTLTFHDFHRGDCNVTSEVSF